MVAVPALRLLRRALPDAPCVLYGPAWVRDVPGFPVLPPPAGDAPRPIDDVPLHASGGSPSPLVLVNLHGRGPESHARLDALVPDGAVARRIGHAAPGWDGPPWTDDPTRPERRRWCDLLAACGLVSPDEAASAADDLRLPEPPPPNVGTGVTVIHPGAAFGSKRWPVERFAAVAGALADAGHDVVVTGGADEVALTRRVPGRDLAGRTSIGDLCRLVAHARLVIAGDTGIAHVATAYGTPSVTLFGPVGPEQWGPPLDPRHVTLTDPSVRRGERFADRPDPALLAIGVQEVLNAAVTVS
ncbi:glycosyltransferase family 9 protein [Actinomycetospora termitidis]|uniref:Glycosyltransferase family 9 protein n=1 Tax=Actinomycetospora termitidis TaxID=3053470 RepID=A0ABT7MKN9_9PSEU|nr:glycosyltransferase family 9 protein [Actinomycetospora sp. Odt1-22]MDL5160542.1 glycosyltransferase family 9 protein [Actinomycetospora sp. Odt1-22]